MDIIAVFRTLTILYFLRMDQMENMSLLILTKTFVIHKSKQKLQNFQIKLGLAQTIIITQFIHILHAHMKF